MGDEARCPGESTGPARGIVTRPPPPRLQRLHHARSASSRHFQRQSTCSKRARAATELGLHSRRMFRLVLVRGRARGREEAQVKPRRRRSHVLEVDEDSSGSRPGRSPVEHALRSASSGDGEAEQTTSSGAADQSRAPPPPWVDDLDTPSQWKRARPPEHGGRNPPRGRPMELRRRAPSGAVSLRVEDLPFAAGTSSSSAASPSTRCGSCPQGEYLSACSRVDSHSRSLALRFTPDNRKPQGTAGTRGDRMLPARLACGRGSAMLPGLKKHTN